MDLLKTLIEFFKAFVAWVMALFTTTPPSVPPPNVSAKMDLSPGIAKMDLSPGIAKMTLFSPISVPVEIVAPPTPVVPQSIKPLPPNSLVLINDGREYQIKGKYKNQAVALFDDKRFGKGSSDVYTVGQIVLFRFTDPATKEENFVNLKMTKFYTKFEDLGFFQINAKYFTAQIVESYENPLIGIY